MKKSLLYSKSLTTMLVLIVMFFTTIVSAQKTWTGNNNTSWNNAGNWLPVGVPSASDNVTIPVVTNQPTVAGTVQALCNNITIDSGAELTLNGGAGTDRLTVSGNFTNNGTLTAAIGTIVAFNGSSQIIDGTSTTVFGSLKIQSSGTVTSSVKVFSALRDVNVVSGNLILEATDANYVINRDLIVATTGTFTHNVDFLTTLRWILVKDDVLIDGVFTGSPNSYLQMDGTNAADITTAATIRSGANSLSKFSIVSLVNPSKTISASGPLVIDKRFFVGSGVAGGTFATNGNDVTVNNGVEASGGNININGGTFNVTAGGFNIGAAETSTVTLSSGTLNTNALTIGSPSFSGTFNQTSANATTVNVNGDLAINSTGSYIFAGAGVKAINVKGNWTNNGTYTRSAEVVTFNGGITQSIDGTNASNFNDLVIASGSKLNLSTSLNTAVTLNLGGSPVALGTWGSTTSTADNKNDTYFDVSSAQYIFIGLKPKANIRNVSSEAICYGETTVNLSGVVRNGNVYAENGSIVSITINGETQNAVIAGGAGAFSLDYSILEIPASSTPYPVSYDFAGDANLSAANTNTTTFLAVNFPSAVGTISPAIQIICGNSGTLESDITLSSATGLIAWYKADNINFTNGVQIVGANTTVLTSAQIGTLTADTYFRAYVKSGACTTVLSNTVKASVGQAETKWNGSTWSNGDPSISKPVVIEGNYTASANLSACSLTVNSGVVTIPAGLNVFINGGITVNGGSLTLDSNANLVQDTNAVNTGNITVKRNSSALYRLDYTLWSSPVSGSQTLLNFSPLTSTTPSRFLTYNTTTDQYNAVDPSSTTFDVAKGYLIRMPNNWPAYPAGPATSWGGEFTGVPNNGLITFPMSLTGTQFNATGNPYPSTILMSTFIQENTLNITGTLWFWRKTNDANNPTSYSTCTTAGCDLANGAVYASQNFISPGQGFLVKATSSSLKYNNTMRVANNNNQFFKTAEKNRYWLELTNNENVSFGRNLIAYLSEATIGYDKGYDGVSFNEMPTTLLTQSGDQQVVIQARPEFDINDVLPLIFKAEKPGVYTISLSEVEGVFKTDQNVYLKDNVANTVHNLSAGNYAFTSEAGSFTSRFEISYQTSLLGVNATDFNENSIVVYKQNNDLLINSGATNMSNVKVYDLQGRLLVDKSNINAGQVRITTGTTNQVLLLKITSENNGVVTKKVVN